VKRTYYYFVFDSGLNYLIPCGFPYLLFYVNTSIQVEYECSGESLPALEFYSVMYNHGNSIFLDYSKIYLIDMLGHAEHSFSYYIGVGIRSHFKFILSDKDKRSS
jgi:hypothetical protein